MGVGASRGGGDAQGGKRAVCPQRGENSEGLSHLGGAETYRCASLFRARARHGRHLGHHGGAAAVLRAAGRTHDDQPARARSAAAVARDEKNTIVFERPRKEQHVFAKLAHDQSKLENPKEGKTG